MVFRINKLRMNGRRRFVSCFFSCGKAIFWKDDSGRMPERKIKKDYVKENVDYIFTNAAEILQMKMQDDEFLKKK